MSTLVKDLIDVHGIDIDPHLDRDALVPVSGGLQRQGDVIVIPEAMNSSMHAAIERVREATSGKHVPRDGFPVVRGEAGGNTHLLLADGDVRYLSLAIPMSDNTIGALRVAPDAVAYLAHPEHGYMGIGPGIYTIRRQRERQAQSTVLVAD